MFKIQGEEFQQRRDVQALGKEVPAEEGCTRFTERRFSKRRSIIAKGEGLPGTGEKKSREEGGMFRVKGEGARSSSKRDV